MAEPSEVRGEHLAVVAAEEGKPAELDKARQRHLEKQSTARQDEAMALRMAGLTFAQIADRMDLTATGALDLFNRALAKRGQPKVDEYRALENARLDRAQSAIWTQVLAGDIKAIDAFLRISQRRAKLNGMDAPLDISISVNVRQEMEIALSRLEDVVLGHVIQGEVLDDRRAD